MSLFFASNSDALFKCVAVRPSSSPTLHLRLVSVNFVVINQLIDIIERTINFYTYFCTDITKRKESIT